MDRYVAVLLLLLAFGPGLAAQAPSESWRTIETAHFRVHYPAEYEAWATRAASRLESIRDVVSREIGFEPSQTIDVLIINPIADANGSAWPLLDSPRMIFYAETPGPEEQIGTYGHWIDLLAVHETAHLVHLLRPSRNPFQRLLERSVLPLNPIAQRAPRWVVEGYATVIEGRLTGSGRPSSTIRALILRRWAEAGRLPTYAQLNSDRRFLGMSMAYLAGSAFLEWLEQQEPARELPPGAALGNLWTRLTARHRRSFDEAFIGVFGERPDVLYGRFAAELTASAITIRRSGELEEGALFQETSWATGDPAVSPDGESLAIVLRPRQGPQKLVVWSTGEPTEEETKQKEAIEELLAADPEDVAPVRTKPLPRKARHSLVMPDGGDIDGPRWAADGKSIVFAHRVPDGDGFLHYDLYRWDFSRLERITRFADVREADPHPDGRRAIAIRSRHGATQLVEVDLATGDVTPRTEASVDVVVRQPRYSPDGERIAHVAHRDGRWHLVVEGQTVDLAGDVSAPAWLSNDSLVVTLSRGGFAELQRVALDGNGMQITRTAGGAWQAAPAKDGRIFFMSIGPDGSVVRVIDGANQAARWNTYSALHVPAIPPRPATGTRFDAQQVASRPYGIGRQELSWFTSTNLAEDHRALELGVRLGDIVGRLDTLLIGSIGDEDAPDGLALATAWRGWPVELHGHAFTTDDQDGLELRGVWSRVFPASRLTLEAGALSDDLVFGSGQFAIRQRRGSARLEESLRVDVDDSHWRAVAAAAFRSGSLRVGVRYQIDRGDTVALGGLASSVLPRSAYALRVLDPALPARAISSDDYDGWRVETAAPGLPLTVFYQRHEPGTSRISLAGIEARFAMPPTPILKVPGLDFTAGGAYVVDGVGEVVPEGETRWWLGMRWRP